MVYRTIDNSGPATSLSFADFSESSMVAVFDSLACAIARWNSSHRCRDASFLSLAAGDSFSLCFLDMISRGVPSLNVSDYREPEYVPP